MIGWLDIVFAIIGIIAGLFFIAIGTFYLLDMNLAIEGRARGSDIANQLSNISTETLVYLLFALGVILLLLGILSFIVGRGTLKGKPWSWTVNLVLTFTGTTFNIIWVICTIATFGTSQV